MNEQPNQIILNQQFAWKTGATKVDGYSGKEVFQYKTSNGAEVYISKDGTVVVDVKGSK